MAEAKSRREAPSARSKRVKTEFAADLQDELPPLVPPTPVQPTPSKAAEVAPAEAVAVAAPPRPAPAPPAPKWPRQSPRRGLSL